MIDYEALILEREEREAHSELEPAQSGYVNCACRDCFEIAISSDAPPHFCHECEAAGCDVDSECQCDGAYNG